MFEILAYSEHCHIQTEPWYFRTRGISSESCQTSMMERTYLTNAIIFAASYNYLHNISFSPSLLYSHLIFTSKVLILCKKGLLDTVQKMKFTIKNFFSKCDQIRKKLRIWSHLLKKSLMKNFIFCTV